MKLMKDLVHLSQMAILMILNRLEISIETMFQRLNLVANQILEQVWTEVEWKMSIELWMTLEQTIPNIQEAFCNNLR